MENEAVRKPCLEKSVLPSFAFIAIVLGTSIHAGIVEVRACPCQVGLLI